MTTTTNVNRENVLLCLNGEYNEEVHKKLNGIIHNIAVNKVKTNPTLSLEDLKQEAWTHIFKTIRKNLQEGRELEISYLVVTAQTTILGNCEKETKRISLIDDFGSCLMSQSEGKFTETKNNVNYAKSKMEYEISTKKPREEKQILDRIALEDLLNSINNDLVRNLIIIKYVKEFGGTSEKICKMYEDFYNSIDDNRRAILDNMDKFTNNAAFKALNMRATDNLSTKIRYEMKVALSTII